MKQIITFKSVALLSVIFLLTIGCTSQVSVRQETAAAVTTLTATANNTSQTVSAVAPTTNEPSCATPRAEDVAYCQAMEAEILASTVRLDLRIYSLNEDGGYTLEDVSIAHATVVEGRYLLTHNHFGLELADFQDGRRRILTVYRPDGTVILKDAPFGSFEVTAASKQVLIFDFGDFGSEGLFATLGLHSAKYDPQQIAQLQPGLEVAQLDWDGSTAHVDWVKIQDIRMEEGVSVLVLDNLVQSGASGGGVFYNGYHLATNWFIHIEQTTTGQLLQQYTAAAIDQGSNITAVADEKLISS